MAITGAGWVLYLIAHMLGNLQIFAGPDGINEYAAALREMPAVLWAARGLLLLGILFHIGLAIRLRTLSASARPVKYVKRSYRKASPAGRAMLLSGLILLSFLAYHLAHYTLHLTNPEFAGLTDAQGRFDVYTMVIIGFQNKAIAALYIISVALVCMHLMHGIPSLFQTFGLRHPKYTPLLNKAGVGLAVILFIGFAVVPIGVMAGWVDPELGAVAMGGN
jgi:succinate dehydrogenase / fumarate reductase cytochrome b subunit